MGGRSPFQGGITMAHVFGWPQERETSASLEDDDSLRILPLMPAIRSYFTKRAPRSEVEDLTQEVCARLLARPSLDGIANLEGYLFQVAANVLATKGRRERVRHVAAHVELTELHHPVEENSPERILMQREVLKAMAEMVQELPPRTRDAFVLHRFEEMTYETIARRMGVSVSAVEKHIIKALRLLTARFKAMDL
jgi:RNA polymerase sigma-70 factor (ECF subfamily)